jgi:PAS domain S-box-containing protein
LVQEERQRVSVLELLPVIRARAIPEKEQPGRIVGFAVAVVKVDEMIEIATKGHVPAGLVFQLTDPHAPDGQGLLYHPGSPDDTPMRTARAVHWKTTLRMGDRDWELSVYTTGDYRRRHRSWMVWAVGVAGLLFGALLQILLLGMTGRTFMQKMAREKLAHSYDLMRYIIEHANSAVAVHDRELRYIYVSQRYLDEYKVKERDVIGKHLYDIFPDLPQKWRDVHQRALAGEVSSVDRDPYYRADGTTEWTRWECRPWYEAGGTIGGIIVYTEVITERVWAEEAMIRSEALLSKSQEIAHIGSWERDLVANRLTWSHEVYRIFGVLPEEFTPSVEAFFEAVHPDDRETVNAVYSESVREGRDTFEIEHRLVRGDNGEVRFVLEKCEHVKDAVGSIVRSVGMVQDITERRQAEAELRESEERYRSLVETTSDWIWEVDAEARYVYASDKVRELLGYTPEEVIGRTPFDLMPEPEARRLESQFMGIVAQWLPFAALENTNLHKNGRAVVLETSGVPLFGPNGEFRGYRGMDRDITERKRTEEALRESEEKYRRLIETTGTGFVIVDDQG